MMLTVEEACAYVGIDPGSLNPSETLVMQSAINSYSEALRAYTGRYLTLASWIDTYTNPSELILSAWPIVSVTEIKVGDVVVDPSQYRVVKKTGLIKGVYQGISYNNFLQIQHWYYSHYDRHVQVSYSGGYDPLPADLAMLLADFAKDRLNLSRASSGNQQSAMQLSGTLRRVIIEGVGEVDMADQNAGTGAGFSRSSAAAGGPILGAGVMVADPYRDFNVYVGLDRHLMDTEQVEPEEV